MSKARASTAETSKPSEEAVGEGKRRKESVKKTTARVLGRSSIMRDDDEEEEDAAPAPKAQKLMGDAIRSGAAPSKPKAAPKATAPAQSLNPRGTPEVFLLRRRTRSQCLKLLKKRKMTHLF